MAIQLVSKNKQFSLLGWVAWVAFLPCTACAGSTLGFGPWLEDAPLVGREGRRLEAIGPLFYLEEQLGGVQEAAFVPWISYSTQPDVDAEEIDLFYPIFTYNRFGKESRWHILQLLSLSTGADQEDRVDRVITVFPFYFRRDSVEPGRRYEAFFPFYGQLKNRLFRDEIRFILFPFYVETRRKGVETDNYLTPVVHFRRGPGLSGWQVWPLAGHEVKALTCVTNIAGEIDYVGGHDKTFALWPLFFRENTGLGTANPRTYRAWLPFYTWDRSPERDATTWLYPLITHVNDRQQGYEEWAVPWPLVVFARGPGKTADRVWPFYSQVRKGPLSSRFVMWPVYLNKRAELETYYREHTRILFMGWQEILELNQETGQSRRRVDQWPLFTWRRDFEGRERLQILAPLEALLPGSRAVERNWSPLWSIYRQERNPGRGRSSQSLLWNLYRQDRTPETRKVSLLFGLFQYQSSEAGRRYRVLYVPWGKAKAKAAESTPGEGP
jgi:hypothetical protein